MTFDFDAGKYAFFVWGSYGATAVVVAAVVVETLLRSAKWRREAERLQAEKDIRTGKTAAKS